MELKETLLMPKGKFEMRGNLTIKEPILVEYFQKIRLYELMLKKNEGHKSFYLHDGPAYANGDIHAGHALNKILKDIIVRFHTLNGEYTPYQPGWDTHGLPIEVMVVKSGVDRKKVSVAEFRKKCYEYALTQVEHQKKQTLRLGCVGNFDNPYLTLSKEYETAQIKIFLKLLEDKLIYKGLKPVNWSPSSESALAEAEIEYKDVVAKTIYVKFPIIKGKEQAKRGYNFVIWTTTPWTLPANLAVCLNADIEYGLYETDQGKLIFASSLLDELTEKLNLTNVKLKGLLKGKEMENIVCSHPFLEDRTSLVILGDHVTAEGTGCVHTAPGHGMEDYLVGQKYHLKPFCPVDSKGYMTNEAGARLAGMFYEEANDEVINLLKETGCLLKQIDITHAYPHDWRTHKPLIFRATPQWFFDQKSLQKRLVEEASKVSFLPEWGKVRLINMLKGRDEWCLSRQRAWGVPIPVIYKDGEPLVNKKICDHIVQLFEKYGSSIWYEKEAKDLLPDEYKDVKGKFTKETDIMDVWFDSGVSFYAAGIQRNMPFPADIYLEGNDQYRGWYNSSMILSTAFLNSTPYKKIITHGFICDQNGEKFSKSKKNGIDPNDIVKEYGADILRLWTTTIDYNTAEIKFSRELMKVCSESYRKIRNVFKFMLANLYDNDEKMFEHTKFDVSNLSYVDRLFLNKFASLMNVVKEKYEQCDFLQVNSLIMNFIVNDLSSFYLDYNKDNLYCNKVDSLPRRSCQYVLFKICYSLAVALSPILPFTMEEVYNNLGLKDTKLSVALEDFPLFGKADEKLLNEYDTLMSIRDKVNISLEEVRKNLEIKGSNEAGVVFNANSDEKALIEKIGLNKINAIFNVSKFELGSETKAYKLSNYHRCDRCWNYFESVEQINSSNLCERCKKVVLDE